MGQDNSQQPQSESQTHYVALNQSRNQTPQEESKEYTPTSKLLANKTDLSVSISTDPISRENLPVASVQGSSSTNRGLLSRKMKAIVFINIYCIFDTIDNINAKTAMKNDVDVIDLALSRIAFNFLSACCFVYFCGQHIT